MIMGGMEFFQVEGAWRNKALRCFDNLLVIVGVLILIYLLSFVHARWNCKLIEIKYVVGCFVVTIKMNCWTIYIYCALFS